MGLANLSCEEFVSELSSKAAVPGGGGASALVGSLGIALGNMVANLTVGKKKYADVEADIISMREKAYELQKDFLELIEKDAKEFEPLSKAYGLPTDTDEQKEYKEKVMEESLRRASMVPLEIMEKCCEAIKLQEEFAHKGSALAVSDAGVGVELCAAALKGASLNVFINTKAMKDRSYAKEVNDKANAMLSEYIPLANDVFRYVSGRLV